MLCWLWHLTLSSFVFYESNILFLWNAPINGGNVLFEKLKVDLIEWNIYDELMEWQNQDFVKKQTSFIELISTENKLIVIEVTTWFTKMDLTELTVLIYICLPKLHYCCWLTMVPNKLGCGPPKNGPEPVVLMDGCHSKLPFLLLVDNASRGSHVVREFRRPP